jgi:hypothetical protein
MNISTRHGHINAVGSEILVLGEQSPLCRKLNLINGSLNRCLH